MAERKAPQSRRQAGAEIDGDPEGKLSPTEDFDRAQRQDNLFRAMRLEGIDHVAIAVPDLAQTAEWYREILGFERLHADKWGGVPTFIGLGSTAIALFPDKKNSRHANNGGPMLHLAFRTDRAGFVRAQAELNKHGISFRFEDHGIAHSIYFHDLNQMKLEITTYEVE
jgi:catechol 2,3-dioxygenase-like lactoylglutathione lyase family enzyme